MRASFVSSIALFASLSLVGCGSSVSAEPVKGPDGDPGWYVVRCKDDPSACSAEMGSVCPAGYEVADDFEKHEFEANHPGTHDGKLIHCRMTRGSGY
jgi:hypothetical protein